LDGTVNFIHGIPQGLRLGGGVKKKVWFWPAVVCLILFGMNCFLATRGARRHIKWATHGRFQRVGSLCAAWLSRGFPMIIKSTRDEHARILTPFLEKMSDIRRFGAAAIDLLVDRVADAPMLI